MVRGVFTQVRLRIERLRDAQARVPIPLALFAFQSQHAREPQESLGRNGRRRTVDRLVGIIRLRRAGVTFRHVREPRRAGVPKGDPVTCGMIEVEIRGDACGAAELLL